MWKIDALREGSICFSTAVKKTWYALSSISPLICLSVHRKMSFLGGKQAMVNRQLTAKFCFQCCGDRILIKKSRQSLNIGNHVHVSAFWVVGSSAWNFS